MLESRHQFREDLGALERRSLEALDMVVGALARALDATVRQDVTLAGLVVEADDRIDRCYLEVHQGLLSLLARQSPVAGDLRIVAALLHTIRCIERMGDQCVNIAKLVPLSSPDHPKDAEIVELIERMGGLAGGLVTQAHDAFATRDVTLARELVTRNAEIVTLNRAIFNRAVAIGDELELREWAMFMILVARAIERIADNTVDVAEQTVFIVTGLFREFADISETR